MIYIKNKKRMKYFDEFINESGMTDDYTPPVYVAQPHAGEKGFFMFKKAFDKMKSKDSTKKFVPHIEWKFADEILCGEKK